LVTRIIGDHGGHRRGDPHVPQVAPQGAEVRGVVLEPGVHEHVGGREALRRLQPQQRPDQAPRPRRQPLGGIELPPADLAEEQRVLGIVERVPSYQYGIQDNPQTPHVGGAARVLGVRPQDLRTHVGGAAPLVVKKVVVGGGQHHRVFQRLEF